ncbi:hypothetical protein J9317_19795 [Metabacillus sp. KIGAM252]|uniref:Uncharacterized protein n=1 Tax=Metabacillus flavus TaxID=2823519 RepID=A0ABS5LJR6_9BACI|nr:hypothetical protein [Metabacillus flavus]MBS2970990.1 hypothetical protein [Metabacillus flavus]
MERTFRTAADLVYRQPEFIRYSLFIFLGAAILMSGYGLGCLAGILLF